MGGIEVVVMRPAAHDAFMFGVYTAREKSAMS